MANWKLAWFHLGLAAAVAIDRRAAQEADSLIPTASDRSATKSHDDTASSTTRTLPAGCYHDVNPESDDGSEDDKGFLGSLDCILFPEDEEMALPYDEYIEHKKEEEEKEAKEKAERSGVLATRMQAGALALTVAVAMGGQW